MARRLIPSLNRILVEKIVPHSKTYSGISLRETTTKLNSGKVVAVGPGAHDNDRKLIPVSVKEGDTVLLPGYGGTKVKHGDKERVIDRGCGSKRLKRRIDLKRSTSSIGIVERIEYDPNRTSRIALVRWVEGVQRKCNMMEEFAPPQKLLEPTRTTIRGLFSFSSLPGKVDQRKVACEKDIFLSAFSSPKGETASLPFGSSCGFPRVAVAGAKPTFFAPRMREKLGGKNTFSLCEVRKLRSHSSLWAHRIKRKAALSWQSFRRQDTLGLVGAAEHNKSKPKTDEGSLPSKLMGKRAKEGSCKVDRAPVTYIIASHQLKAGSMVMNCDWSKPSITH